MKQGAVLGFHGIAVQTLAGTEVFHIGQQAVIPFVGAHCEHAANGRHTGSGGGRFQHFAALGADGFQGHAQMGRVYISYGLGAGLMIGSFTLGFTAEAAGLGGSAGGILPFVLAAAGCHRKDKCQNKGKRNQSFHSSLLCGFNMIFILVKEQKVKIIL